MDVNPRAVGAETKQEDAMVGDRQGKGDRSATGPSVDDVVQAAWRREVKQSVDAGGRHELAQGKHDRCRREPYLHVDGVRKEKVEVWLSGRKPLTGDNADSKRDQSEGHERDR